MLEQLKQKIKAALARFAKRKASEQAEGMAIEARGIVASTQALARRNPVGFAMLVLLGAGLLYLWQRPRRRALTPVVSTSV
jgi:hypothetical protein